MVLFNNGILFLKKHEYRTKLRIAFTFLLLAGLSFLAIGPFLPKEIATSSEFLIKTSKKPEDNAMLHPHFQGIDSEGRPYSVLAHYAKHISPDEICLHDIDGNIQSKSNKNIALVAKKGSLLLSSRSLSLYEGIDIFFEEGYEIHTESAALNIPQGTAEGHDAIEIQHHGSLLKAKGFSITEKGDKITFTGPIFLKYIPREKLNKKG